MKLQKGWTMKAKSRRAFVVGAVGGLNAAWVTANFQGILAAQQYARKVSESGQPPRLEFFTPEQALEIDAMISQIIPTDETPGAREARCLYFIDRALTTFARSDQSNYIQGLQLLQATAIQLFPTGVKFSALTPEQQIKTLTAMETTPFFNMVRNHTVIGFFARPAHGGNYKKVGWKLIGYDDSLKHKPPFGYYDAQHESRRKS
jgi:gluconate 2-dehydrogenase gamma chain